MLPLNVLGLAFGAAWSSGINVYATVATLGLLQHYEVAQLPGGLEVLDNWIIIGVALFMYAVEFVADKIPVLEHLWDALHTFIRVRGAIVAVCNVDLNPTCNRGFAFGRRPCAFDARTKATRRRS